MPVERLTPERRRELTRTTLVEAASEVFARKGFHAASLEEIAEAAGFSRGAIYSNFESKEDLLAAVIDHYNDLLLEAFGGVLESHQGDSPDDLAAASAATWTYRVHRDPAIMLLGLELRLFALRNPDFRQRLAALDRRQREKATRFMEESMAAAGLRLELPAADFSDIAAAATHGILQFAAVDPEHADRYDRLVEELFVLLAKALVPIDQPPAGADEKSD